MKNHNFNNKLKYRIIETTSEDSEHPGFELIKGMDSNGWMSIRFCTYPQEILIQFLSPVNLKQINILSHEKKISSMIEFYSFFPHSSSDIFTNYKSLNYEKLGYIRMDQNMKTNFKAREFRKIFVNNNCLYLKIVLHKNYINKFNVFNQVSLISIDFFGDSVIFPKTDVFIEETLKSNDFSEEKMDEVALDKINILKRYMNESVRIEDYDDAKRIKKTIDKVRMIGKKLYELDFQKRISINNEDFDKAKLIKIEIERLRSIIRSIDKQVLTLSPFENENNNKTFDGNIHLKIEKLDEDSKSKIENNMSFFGENLDKSMSRANKSVMEEEFVNHDDEIVPALNKKKKISGLEEDLPKVDLEEITQDVLNAWKDFVPFVGEEGLRKIFSHHPIYKTEGLQIFIDNMDVIFSDKSKNINDFINLTMKLNFLMLSEKHNQVGIKALEIFEKLLEKIKILNENTDLHYDLTITDNILAKIKEKVGDVSSKLRKRAVDLYDYMLKQEFCDYNNLISELIDDEIRSEKKFNKSSKTILGKLSILENVLIDFKQAISDKRTDEKNFPFNHILIYIVDSISHPKSEVRKLARSAAIKLYQQFGFSKMEHQLMKVETRELAKLINDIPEVEELIKFEELQKIEMSPEYKNRSQSKDPKTKSLNNSYNHGAKKYLSCPKCDKMDKKFLIEEDILNHQKKNCLMFMNCLKCKKFIEIKNYSNHLVEECSSKDDFKVCKRCKEPVGAKIYDSHVKDNKCNPAKNPISANRCLLCHMDIPPSNKGWYTHLVKEGCYKNLRKK